MQDEELFTFLTGTPELILDGWYPEIDISKLEEKERKFILQEIRGVSKGDLAMMIVKLGIAHKSK